MKLTPDQLARGLAASYALRDHGDPATGVKPISFTGNPTAHVEVIGQALLEGTIDAARATALICQFVGLLKSAYTFDTFDFGYNGRHVPELIAELIAAESATQMLEAFGVE